MNSGEENCWLYEVKPGDSLSSIAARFGYLTPTQLARFNRLSLIGCGLPHVFPGQKLLVPVVTKGSADIHKLRRAPGSALRVSNSSQFCVKSAALSSSDGVDCTAIRERAHSDFSCSSEIGESKFVKVKADRMLLNGEFADGVLLITPDCVCFDATRTRLAQTEVYLASHTLLSSGDLKSSPNSGSLLKNNTPELSKELLDLGLCLPLERIASMVTLKELPESDTLHIGARSSVTLASFSNPQSRERSEESDDVFEHDTKSEESNPTIYHPHTNSFDRASNSFCSANSSIDISSTCVHLESTTTQSLLPLSDNKLRNIDSREVNKRSNKETPICDDKSREICDRGIDKKGVKETLNVLLRLTEFVCPNEPPVNHYFKVSIDEIPTVFAFLLSMGVKTMEKHRGFAKSLHSQDKSTSVTGHPPKLSHRSLVEEALESLDSAPLPPALYDGDSGILSKEMLIELGNNFPTHWIGSNLKLIYKADQDGYSLGTLYRKSRVVDHGVLLLIRDTTGTVFGSILSEKPHCSQHFYGTGETCVFHWNPTFQRYDWTKKNYFFMFGSTNSFQIGCQSGRNAIWFDEALKYGRSETTDTFDNPVLSGCLPAFCLTHHVPQDLVTSDHSNTTKSSSCEWETTHRRPETVVTTNVTPESMPFLIDTLELWELVS